MKWQTWFIALLLIPAVTAAEPPSGADPLRKQLLRDEGLSLELYKDNGHWSIGVGRNLSARGVSRSEAMLMFENDVRDTLTDLDYQIPWVRNLDPARRGVLANMAFNLGIGGLLEMEAVLNATRAGAYQKAAKLMLQTKWAKQVGKRADRLAKQMATGVWQ